MTSTHLLGGKPRLPAGLADPVLTWSQSASGAWDPQLPSQYNVPLSQDTLSLVHEGPVFTVGSGWGAVPRLLSCFLSIRWIQLNVVTVVFFLVATTKCLIEATERREGLPWLTVLEGL